MNLEPQPHKIHIPTFTLCKDGKYYEDLVYQDFPSRRDWFICFDAEEPVEIVIRESAYMATGPKDILKRRGFNDCIKGVFNGRKDKHMRFFGPPLQLGGPLEGHVAISWFLILNRGVPLPTPNQYDSCVQIWPVFPNRDGVYYGVKGRGK